MPRDSASPRPPRADPAAPMNSVVTPSSRAPSARTSHNFLEFRAHRTKSPEAMQPAATNRSVLDILLSLGSLALFLGLIGWVMWRWLKQSEDPAQLIIKWVFTRRGSWPG